MKSSKQQPKPQPDIPPPSYRWVALAFGLLFVGVAIAMFYLAEDGYRLRSYGAAAVVGGLGIDSLVSAARNRWSLLSHIGYLP